MNSRYYKYNISQCVRFSKQQKRFSKTEGFFYLISLPFRMEIPFVEYSITTRCTLKCKKCSNLIPYFQNPKDKSLEEMKCEISNFLSKVDYVYRFKVLGGEPFLNKHLSELLVWLLNQSNIGEIHVSTNGTIIPTDELLCALKNDRILVYLSDYPEKVAPNRSSVLTAFINNGVRVNNLVNQQWCDTGDCSLRNRSISKTKKVVEKCFMCNCKVLYNNRIYMCSRCSNGDALGFFKEHVYVDLNEKKSKVRKNLFKFYMKYYSSGCMHCDSVSDIENNLIPAAEQL